MLQVQAWAYFDPEHVLAQARATRNVLTPMPYKIVAGILAAALLLAYMAPVVWRLQDYALWVVALIGVGMMLVDLWQSLRKDD